MKKIFFIFIVILFLTSCENKGCNNETVEFGHKGILTFYVDENPLKRLEEVSLKVIKNGKENIIKLNSKEVFVENFSFDKIGEYEALVKYKNKVYKLKYNVEIRKWNQKYDISWYNEASNEFEIDSSNQLAGLAHLVNSGNTFEGKKISLNYDIDLNNLPWIPIGTNGLGVYTEINKCFKGTFDGKNHTIYNLCHNATHKQNNEHIDPITSYYHFGLFGYVNNALIENIKLENINIINGMGNDFIRSFQGTAALVGYTSGHVTLNNIKILGNILIKGEYKIGGIVGCSSGGKLELNNSSIISSDNSFIGGTDEEYKDTNYYGGLIGFSSASNTILNNVLSDIDVDGFTSGGLIGNVSEGKLEVTNACVYGTISNKQGSVVGGFVGGRFSEMKFTNCYMFGSVISKDNSYADIIVSKYGDLSQNIYIFEVYYNISNLNTDKVSNSLNITGKTKEELDILIKGKF